MKLRYFGCAIVAYGLASFSLSFRAQTPQSDPYLTAHEWGTFTSIAGKDGGAVEWLPLTGSTDLPSFVEHYRTGAFKVGLRGTVRMETPVLYFYTNHETTVAVHVSFSKGLITEWYPHADRVDPVRAAASKASYFNDRLVYDAKADGSISWDSVKVEPRGSGDFPHDAGANHYYAARATSATPLRVFSRGSEQTEKFLFYRGVSTMSVPLSVRLQSDGKVRPKAWVWHKFPQCCSSNAAGRKSGSA